MGGRGADENANANADADGAEALGEGPIRMVLSVPLPCGMGACRQPAREALAEPDPVCPGAWVLLPICPACGAGARAEARRIAMRA